MPLPGAYRSTQVPKFEYEAWASVLSVAPTVMASASRAGDWRQALRLSLPAATAYVTPEAIEAFTALSSVLPASPPRLMLATAGLTACWVTQSTPAMICEYEPLPWQSRTRTETSCTSLAMPYWLPPTVPATCVP